METLPTKFGNAKLVKEDTDGTIHKEIVSREECLRLKTVLKQIRQDAVNARKVIFIME